MGLATPRPCAGALTAASLLEPGRNCWQVAQADRAAVLVDGAAYFARAEEAFEAARRSILIVGWDFDGRIRLRPQAGEKGRPLGEMLHALVEARPELEIRILVWSIAPLHAPSEARPLVFGARWQDHPRIHLRLDTRHPIYGAHHQKIVCIDDDLAFVGGIDFTVDRWDTTRHDAGDPLRKSPEGSAYGPVHDLQMVVDGDAARALSDLAHLRWRQATGDAAEPVRPGREPLWPADLEPDFQHVPLAIARTAPARGERPALREAAALTLDLLEAARQRIYIETQYLVDFVVGDLLIRHLAKRDGPEILIIAARSLPGAVERFAMGSNRDRLIRRMKQADRFDRLRVCYPVVAGPEGEREILIHSKLIIVDDRLFRLGSSNISNRSVGLDTECDVAIEARNESERRTIVGLRDRLLAEHLGVDPQSVAGALAAEGSLVRTVDALSQDRRGLRAFDALTSTGPTRPIFGTGLLDPRKRFDPLWFLRGKRRRAQHRR